VSDQQEAPKTSRSAGSQTLARGLSALRLVASTPESLGVQDVAERLGIHRTIARRVLTTPADFHLISRSGDGRYRAGMATVALARGYAAGFRETALPVLRRTADDLGATVALIAEEGDEAVAVAVVEPQSVNYHVSYRVGSRHPLRVGAAGSPWPPCTRRTRVSRTRCPRRGGRGTPARTARWSRGPTELPWGRGTLPAELAPPYR
jgi:DNA-binding IclR family transcriptional regulator